jgi:hypothetical protein
MKDLKKIISLTFYLSFCFLFFSINESNAQVKEMSAQDLTTASTAVFYGKCSKKSCDWDENHRIIYTYVTVVPEAYIKGNLGATVTIAVPGGQVGDIVYDVSDMPFFTEGEETVAFVWTNPAGKNLITGGFQGKMKIEKDSKTGNKIVQVNGVMDAADAQIKLPPGQVKKAEKMQLEDFVTKVKGYMKN